MTDVTADIRDTEDTAATEPEHARWSGKTYGNGWMHRWLIRILRVTDVRLLYAFVNMFVVPPTLLVNANARRAIYRYFRRRHCYGRLKSVWQTYRNHCLFAQVVIDRFAMYAGKRFDIAIDNGDEFDRLAAAPGGFIQLSSHIGNYELAGYSLRAETKRFNALVFGGEKATVMANRNRLFCGNNIRMIAVGADMSHLFEIDSALSAGDIVSMPADRVFGSQKTFVASLLGAEARLPQGPFILAALRGVPMLFVAVMKESPRRYRITVRRVDSDTAAPASKRARALAAEYARCLEETLRRYPGQWYNFYDFWESDTDKRD